MVSSSCRKLERISKASFHGATAISTDRCIRLEEALGTSAETWLAMQAAYDLWPAKKYKRRKKIDHLAIDARPPLETQQRKI